MRGCALLAFLVLALPALAGSGPPQAPILQVEVGMHLATIRNLAVDPRGRFVVTVSADKTLRLWELPSLRLRRIFRVPLGSGPEGRLNAVALSPDALTVAAGGWTGWEWEGSASVYFFEVRAFRGTLGVDAEFGPWSNLAGAATLP